MHPGAVWIYNEAMNRAKLKKSLYTAAQWTWALPQTLIGAGLYVKHRNDRHFDYQGACVTAWERKEGISLGKFIFVPGNKNSDRNDSPELSSEENTAYSQACDLTTDAGLREAGMSRFLLDHEYGHTLQSLILGPAYLLLVGAPSMVWNRSRYFARKRQKTGRSYYSAIFERTASRLGEKVSGNK